MDFNDGERGIFYFFGDDVGLILKAKENRKRKPEMKKWIILN